MPLSPDLARRNDVDFARTAADEHAVPVAAFRPRGAAGVGRERTARRRYGGGCVPADPATAGRGATDRLADRAGQSLALAERAQTPLGRPPSGGGAAGPLARGRLLFPRRAGPS